MSLRDRGAELWLAARSDFLDAGVSPRVEETLAEARSLLRTGAEIARSIPSDTLVAGILVNLAFTYELTDPDSSRTILERSLMASRRADHPALTAWILNQLAAWAPSESEAIDQRLEALDLVAGQGNTFVEFDVRSSLGITYFKLQQYGPAIEQLEAALALPESQSMPPGHLAAVFDYAGQTYLQLELYDDASRYLDSASVLYEAAGPQFRLHALAGRLKSLEAGAPELSWDCSSYEPSFEQSQLYMASYAETASQLWDALRPHLQQHFGERGMSEMRHFFDDVPSAFEPFFAEASALMSEWCTAGANRPDIDLAVLEPLFIGMRSTLERLEHRMAVLHGVFSGQGVEYHSSLADLAAIAGESRIAIAHYDSALASAQAKGDQLSRVRLHLAKGLTHQRLDTPPKLGRAIVEYALAAAVLDSILSSAGRDRFQVQIGELSGHLFGAWSLALLRRSTEIGEEKATRLALAAADRGRALALRHLVFSAQAGKKEPDRPTFEPIDAERLAVEDVERSLEEEAASLLADISIPFIYYQMALDTLLIWRSDSEGELTVAGSSFSAPLEQMEEIHQAGMPLSLIVDVAASNLRDSLSAMVATLRLSLGAVGAADRTGGDLERSDPVPIGKAGDPAAAAARLADILGIMELPEIRGSGELLIIPQGVLSLVPFTILPLQDGQDASGRREETLGDRYSLRYSPSLSLAVEGNGKRKKPRMGQADAKGSEDADALGDWLKETPHALVVGNPLMPPASTGSEERLKPLPGAEGEAVWIAERLGVELLTGEAASELGVRRRLETAPIVHLATHGLAYNGEERTRDSYIALAPDSSPGGPTTDGHLTVAEILEDGPDLEADLVVLSACQTGLGNVTESEGTIGLQRAFLARGARSVLVSLWNVSDAATRYLMERFYSYWLGLGLSKAESLQRAQQDVRAEEDWAHPKFWAAFQLVGEG